MGRVVLRKRGVVALGVEKGIHRCFLHYADTLPVKDFIIRLFLLACTLILIGYVHAPWKGTAKLSSNLLTHVK